MAVSVVSVTSGSLTTGATSTTTASVTPGADKLMLLSVVSRNNSSLLPATPTITGNGLTWVQIGTTVNYDDTSTSRKSISLFRAMGASPSAGAITIDFGAQSQTDILWVLDEVSGMDTSGTNGSGAIVQSATNMANDAAAPASLTVTLAAFAAAENATYAAFANGTETGTFTAGTGFTKITDQAAGSSNGRLASEFRSDNDTTADMSQSGSTAAMGGIAVEIAAPSSGGISIAWLTA